ncbi:MAG TPA: autotransporter-associated beta strand repeat-containing protein [Lacunisphaera sp.]|nr:autotransporter-associated beta strand repeat-containing protein [Lacunisphaera sp.]
MPPPFHRSTTTFLRTTIVALAIGGGLVATLTAQTVYWDRNGNTAGAGGSTPSGTWINDNSAANRNWSTNVNGTAATARWNDGRDAVFSAGADATGSFTVTVSGAVGVSSINVQEGTINFTGGTINFTDASPDFTVNTGLTTTVNSVIGGSNGLAKAGAGTLSLAGSNTFTGATSVSAGILQLQNGAALGTAGNSSNTTVSSGAALQLTNNITTTNTGTLVLSGTGGGGGALQSVGNNNAWNSHLSLAANATITSATAGKLLTLGNAAGTSLFTLGANTVTFDGAGDFLVNSDVGVAGDTGGLIKNGTGALTLYGYNTKYTGATVVNAGSLNLTVGPFSPGFNGINGSLTIGTGAGAAASVSVNIANNSYTNQISSSSNVTINSDGLLSVGKSTTLGSLTLNGGKVDLLYANTAISPAGSITSNATSAHQTALISGGQVNLSGPTITVARDAALTSDLTISSVINGSALTKEGAGVLTLSGANTYTGATTVNAGTVLLGASNVIADASALVVASGATFDLGWGNSETVASVSGAGTLDLKSGTFTSGDAANTSFTGVIADSGGAGSFVKQGTGTLTLSGNNTYSGVTTINSGVVVAAGNNALGTSTFGNTIANGAALHLQGGVTVNEGSFAVTGTGVGATGAIRNLSGSNTLGGQLNLGGNTTIASDAGTLAATGQVNLGANVLTVTGAGDTNLSGSVTNTGSVTKTGAGTLTFSGTGANSFGGALNVNDGTVVLNKTAGTNAVSGSAINVGDGAGAAGSAVLRLGASHQIADYAGTLTVASDGLFDVNNQTEAIDRLAGNGRIDLGTSGSLTIGANSGNSTFGGTVLGTGTLIKTGSGSLTLQNDLSLSGEFQLNSGTLFLSGYDLSAGTLHITGNSTIDFAGGDSILSVTNFLIDSGIMLTVDHWANAADFFYAQNWTGAAFDTTGVNPMNQITFTGFTNNDTKWLPYGNREVTPVPEPSTYGALLLALSGGFVAWRRRRPASVRRAAEAEVVKVETEVGQR